MMTRQREAASARAARAAARDRLRDRAPRSGLVAKARSIAASTAAAAGDALRAVRRGLGRGAACVAKAPCAPSQAAKAAAGAQADGATAAADTAPPAKKVVLRLIPPPALALVAQQPFDFEGAPFQASPSEAGICVRLAEQAAAASLLECCAAWLRVPAERITIRGAARPLTMASQHRTLAQAGLSARALRRRFPADVAATLHVTVAPWCCICLSPVRRGRVWACAAQHQCCQGCARSFAQSAAVLRPSVAHSWLRCPAAGCAFVLAQGAAMHSLLSFKAMDRLRSRRAAAQALRLSSARAGREVRALAFALCFSVMLAAELTARARRMWGWRRCCEAGR